MTHTCTKVTVRQRAIRNNRISLYLDYYPAVRNPETMQMSRREYLGIYIYAHPKNEMEREFNNDMLNKAEAIRCIRVQSLINEEFGFLDKTKQKADFLAYFKKMCRSKDQKWMFVYQHFYTGRSETTCRHSLRHPRSESRLIVCLSDRFTHQRYSQSSMGRFCHCSRPRLLLAYQNSENPNGSDTPHQLRSL